MNGIMNALPRFSEASARMRITVAIATLFLLAGCSSASDDGPDLSAYQYRDTRDLVRFAYDASQILKRDGLKSLGYFRANRSRYCTSNFYPSTTSRATICFMRECPGWRAGICPI